VDFKILLPVHRVYPQVYVPGKQVNTDHIIGSLGKPDKVDLSVMINTKVVFLSEMNFGPAIPSSQLIALNERQIDRSFLITLILSSLDIYVAINIIQSCKTIGIILFLLVGENKSRYKDQTESKNRYFFHFFSFPNIRRKSKFYANLSPCSAYEVLSSFKDNCPLRCYKGFYISLLGGSIIWTHSLVDVESDPKPQQQR
jgi:hypothetical protein